MCRGSLDQVCVHVQVGALDRLQDQSLQRKLREPARQVQGGSVSKVGLSDGLREQSFENWSKLLGAEEAARYFKQAGEEGGATAGAARASTPPSNAMRAWGRVPGMGAGMPQGGVSSSRGGGSPMSLRSTPSSPTAGYGGLSSRGGTPNSPVARAPSFRDAASGDAAAASGYSSDSHEGRPGSSQGWPESPPYGSSSGVGAVGGAGGRSRPGTGAAVYDLYAKSSRGKAKQTSMSSLVSTSVLQPAMSAPSSPVRAAGSLSSTPSVADSSVLDDLHVRVSSSGLSSDGGGGGSSSASSPGVGGGKVLPKLAAGGADILTPTPPGSVRSVAPNSPRVGSGRPQMMSRLSASTVPPI